MSDCLVLLRDKTSELLQLRDAGDEQLATRRLHQLAASLCIAIQYTDLPQVRFRMNDYLNEVYANFARLLSIMQCRV